MVNEFVLDDLSSSWTDSFYKNKTNSILSKLRPEVYGQSWRLVKPCANNQYCDALYDDLEINLSNKVSSVKACALTWSCANKSHTVSTVYITWFLHDAKLRSGESNGRRNIWLSQMLRSNPLYRVQCLRGISGVIHGAGFDYFSQTLRSNTHISFALEKNKYSKCKV